MFTNGVFDVLHRGHVDYLAKAKSFGDVLIVGLNSDTSVRRLKGPKRPIQSQADRAAIFIAPRIVGDASAISFAAGTGVESLERAWRLVRTEVRTLGSDWLVTGDFERTQ